MQGSMWLMLLYVSVAGAVGGIVNALMTDNGFICQKAKKSRANLLFFGLAILETS